MAPYRALAPRGGKQLRVERDEAPAAADALRLLADAFGTDDITLLGILAPEMEPADVALVAAEVEACPVHLAHVEVCADDGCTAWKEEADQ